MKFFAFGYGFVAQALAKQLGDRATLVDLAEADHSFHMPARSGRTDLQVREAMLDAVAAWALATALA